MLTLIPDTRRLAGPVVEGAASVNDRTPGDSRIGGLSTAPFATWNEMVGSPLNVMPAGRLSLIALPAASAPVAFSSILIFPSACASPGATATGTASAVLVTPAFGVTWMVTVAGALVSGGEQVGLGVPQLSGSPRSLTANVNRSVPVKPGVGVENRCCGFT